MENEDIEKQLYIEQLLNDPMRIGIVVLSVLFAIMIIVLLVMRINQQRIHRPQAPAPQRYDVGALPPSRKRRLHPVPPPRKSDDAEQQDPEQ